jgi:hypothetical protein
MTLHQLLAHLAPWWCLGWHGVFFMKLLWLLCILSLLHYVIGVIKQICLFNLYF